LQSALAAAPLLKALGNLQLEALTYLTLSRIYYKKHDVQASVNSANQAIAIYHSIGDKTGEGECWHSIGSGYVQAYKIAEAIKVSSKAAALYKECGNRKMYARELHILADWNMKRNDHVNALAAAKEAHEIFKEIKYGKGWEASSLNIMVLCLINMQKVDAALREAKRGVKDFKARGDLKEQVRCMIALVSAMAADNDHDEAEGVVEEGITIAQSLGDRHLEIEMRKLATQLSLSAKKFQSALRQAETVKGLYKDLGATKQEAFELMHSVTKVNYLSEDKRKTMESSSEATKLVEELGNKNLEAYAMLASSASQMMAGEPDKAIKAATEAAELFREDGDKMGQARSMLHLSEVQRMQGDLKAAFESASDSLELREELGDRQKQAHVLLHMAEIQIESKKARAAVDLLMDGVKLAKANEDHVTTGKLLIKMAQAYHEMLDGELPTSRMMKEYLEKAMRSGREAAQVTAQTQDMKLEAEAQYWLASLYLLAGKFGDMIQACNDAISLYKQSGSRSGQVNAMCLTAKAFIQQGRSSRATTVLEDAVVLAKNNVDSAGEEKAKALLNEIASREAVTVVVNTGPSAAAAAAAGPSAGAPAAPAASAVAAYTPPDVAIVQARVMEMVSDMAGADDLDADTPFMDAGIDSLASVELRTGLVKTFGVSLPTTVMFSYPSSIGISDFIVAEMTEKEITLA